MFKEQTFQMIDVTFLRAQLAKYCAKCNGDCDGCEIKKIVDYIGGVSV